MYREHRVLRVTSEGKVDKVYSLDAVPDTDFEDAREAVVLSYAVDDRGNVYESARNSKGKTALVKFDSDGDYDEVMDLGLPNFSPVKIAAFAGGELLLSGYVIVANNGHPYPKP